jgi:phosphotriesterase-related protein
MPKIPSGKAQTVSGLVDGDRLGTTLVHEHLFYDASPYFKEPALEMEKQQAYQPVRLDNLYLVRLNPFCNRDNLILQDEQLAVKEALLFKAAGGHTIVDVTMSKDLGRNPGGLATVARQTGLNIIMSTGYFEEAYHPPEVATMTEQQMTDGLIQDITLGVADSGIKAGVIGEIGCSAPLTRNERKVLRCCAAAQNQTGAPISVHPGPADEVAFEISRVLKEAGADLGRVIIGHMDILNMCSTTCRKLMDAGCNIAFDNLGHEGISKIPHIARYFSTSDMNTITDIVNLIKDGYLKQILISHDAATKERLTNYGGTGYAHILRDIVPVMRIKGLSDAQIHALLVENPKRIISGY